jgi:hypothetical protein
VPCASGADGFDWTNAAVDRSLAIMKKSGGRAGCLAKTFATHDRCTRRSGAVVLGFSVRARILFNAAP